MECEEKMENNFVSEVGVVKLEVEVEEDIVEEDIAPPWTQSLHGFQGMEELFQNLVCLACGCDYLSKMETEVGSEETKLFQHFCRFLKVKAGSVGEYYWNGAVPLCEECRKQLLIMVKLQEKIQELEDNLTEVENDFKKMCEMSEGKLEESGIYEKDQRFLRIREQIMKQASDKIKNLIQKRPLITHQNKLVGRKTRRTANVSALPKWSPVVVISAEERKLANKFYVEHIKSEYVFTSSYSAFSDENEMAMFPSSPSLLYLKDEQSEAPSPEAIPHLHSPPTSPQNLEENDDVSPLSVTVSRRKKKAVQRVLRKSNRNRKVRQPERLPQAQVEIAPPKRDKDEDCDYNTTTATGIPDEHHSPIPRYIPIMKYTLPKLFVCPEFECKQAFNTGTSVRMHIKKTHPDFKKAVFCMCGVCGKRTSSTKDFDIHLWTHYGFYDRIEAALRGEKQPFKKGETGKKMRCSICGKNGPAFFLKRHMLKCCPAEWDRIEKEKEDFAAELSKRKLELLTTNQPLEGKTKNPSDTNTSLPKTELLSPSTTDDESEKEDDGDDWALPNLSIASMAMPNFTPIEKKGTDVVKVRRTRNKVYNYKLEEHPVPPRKKKIPSSTNSDLDTSGNWINPAKLKTDPFTRAITYRNFCFEYIESKNLYMCTTCEQTLPLKNVHDRLRFHVIKAHTDRFVCNVCGLHCASRRGLQLHIDGVHNHKRRVEKKRVVKCKICGKPNIQKQFHRIHLWTHYNMEEKMDKMKQGEEAPVKYKSVQKIQCDACGQSCGSKQALKTHKIRVHACAEEKLKWMKLCEVCGKSVLQFDMTQHMKCHSNELDMFPCVTCNKRFPSRSLLNGHRLIHQRMRFHCELCGKRFRHKSSLEGHINLHNNVMPFKCNKCPKAFRAKYSLRWHVKKRHDNITEMVSQKRTCEAPEQLSVPDLEYDQPQQFTKDGGGSLEANNSNSTNESRSGVPVRYAYNQSTDTGNENVDDPLGSYAFMFL